jgi:molecular chaperone GrpE
VDKGHFVPLSSVGSILVNPTFAHNFVLDMKKKDMQENTQHADTELEGAMNINTDENIDGNQHLNEPVTNESEIQKLRDQVDELNDRFIRQAAEFDNYKRRTTKERLELIQTASKDVITELLEVLDDSERAQKQLDTSDDAAQIKEGVQLVFNKLNTILTAKGLKPMEVVGQEFNPDIHDAVTEIVAGDEMKGRIVAEILKGYYLNEKIIRFAKVVVGK